MKIKLGLSSLKELDMGKIAAAFDHEMRHVVNDCLDRPGDETARTVSLCMKMVPDCDSTGVAETVTAEFVIKSTVPPRTSKKYQLQTHRNGHVLVNPESPEDITQGTLDEVLEDGKSGIVDEVGKKTARGR
jgi:hypothetical protein